MNEYEIFKIIRTSVIDGRLKRESLLQNCWTLKSDQRTAICDVIRVYYVIFQIYKKVFPKSCVNGVCQRKDKN